MDVEKLQVWQSVMDLAETVYKITDKFPKTEIFGITDQMRRAAVSIPSNIAEGRGRSSTKDFVRFLNIAKGSLYELQTQCILANKIGYLDQENYRSITKRSSKHWHSQSCPFSVTHSLSLSSAQYPQASTPLISPSSLCKHIPPRDPEMNNVLFHQHISAPKNSD
ncbi:four helix bundle protein [Kosmotoga sp.]|uniref:four helix bundle protein n=1 Tax=Kosmotoga sp. TaxID=1955248 RepID=UPI0025B82F74|nr:four helix bundle protein [Kosmotoga sp.]